MDRQVPADSPVDCGEHEPANRRLALPEFREVPFMLANEHAVPEPPASVARRLGVEFSNVSLLTRALTHRSYLNENTHAMEDNERLEFLGDAVLDFIVGAWVYNRCPEMAEGDLTRLRSALVRNEQLAEFARQLDLGKGLRMGRGESASGGRERDGVLGSAFEAVVGAMYLDSGLPTVEKFMESLLENVRERVMMKAEIYDPKSRFQEWAQSAKLGTPRYVTIAATGPDHAKEFEVEVRIKDQTYGRGSGPSKQVAAQIAAQSALDALGVH